MSPELDVHVDEVDVASPVLPAAPDESVHTDDEVVPHGVPAMTPRSVPVHHDLSEGKPAFASEVPSNTGGLANMLLHVDAMTAPLGP